MLKERKAYKPIVQDEQPLSSSLLQILANKLVSGWNRIHAAHWIEAGRGQPHVFRIRCRYECSIDCSCGLSPPFGP